MRLDVLMDDQTGQAFAQLAVGDERDVYRLVVPGRPVPATRLTRRNLHTRAGRQYMGYVNRMLRMAREARLQPVEGPVEVVSVAYVHGNRGEHAHQFAQPVLEALDGIAWIDRRQVRRVTTEVRSVDTVVLEGTEIVIRKYRGEGIG